MPAKYHIHTHPAPPRNKPIGKYGIVDWREDCSACHNCVKRECAYSVYNDERDRLQDDGRLRGLPLRVQGLPVLRSELHQGPADLGGQPRVSERWATRSGRRTSYPAPGIRPRRAASPSPARAIPGRSEAGVRLDPDRHVRDRPPHPRRHPRQRVYQHVGRYRPQADEAGVQRRRALADRVPAAGRDSAAGDLQHDALAHARR